MAIIDLEATKARLGITTDTDDDLITALLDEAQAFIEGQLGYELDEDSPADLRTAVAAQCAHLYENREASMVGVTIAAVPFSVEDIIANHRNYWGYQDGA